jgi:hypothetical protein
VPPRTRQHAAATLRLHLVSLVSLSFSFDRSFGFFARRRRSRPISPPRRRSINGPTSICSIGTCTPNANIRSILIKHKRPSRHRRRSTANRTRSTLTTPHQTSTTARSPYVLGLDTGPTRVQHVLSCLVPRTDDVEPHRTRRQTSTNSQHSRHTTRRVARSTTTTNDTARPLSPTQRSTSPDCSVSRRSRTVNDQPSSTQADTWK